jgi:hypothetical protein
MGQEGGGGNVSKATVIRVLLALTSFGALWLVAAAPLMHG